MILKEDAIHTTYGELKRVDALLTPVFTKKLDPRTAYELRELLIVLRRHLEPGDKVLQDIQQRLRNELEELRVKLDTQVGNEEPSEFAATRAEHQKEADVLSAVEIVMKDVTSVSLDTLERTGWEFTTFDMELLGPLVRA